ncbi:hypothetical protein GYH30_036693 [Glycine max]|uniref:Uncharacterized protein n=1 Tax=Glycine max TaxID=3847 RepID=A0A0R0GRB5_SOYBN|nr:hypothetical protein GYH30_036693 [Glycine max]
MTSLISLCTELKAPFLLHLFSLPHFFYLPPPCTTISPPHATAPCCRHHLSTMLLPLTKASAFPSISALVSETNELRRTRGVKVAATILEDGEH